MSPFACCSHIALRSIAHALLAGLLAHMAPSEVAKPSKWFLSRSTARADAQKSIHSAGPAPLGGLGTPDRAMQTATSRASTAVLRGAGDRNERARVRPDDARHFRRKCHVPIPGTGFSSSIKHGGIIHIHSTLMYEDVRTVYGLICISKRSLHLRTERQGVERMRCDCAVALNLKCEN